MLEKNRFLDIKCALCKESYTLQLKPEFYIHHDGKYEDEIKEIKIKDDFLKEIQKITNNS